VHPALQVEKAMLIICTTGLFIGSLSTAYGLTTQPLHMNVLENRTELATFPDLNVTSLNTLKKIDALSGNEFNKFLEKHIA
jgi:hypothetical protein